MHTVRLELTTKIASIFHSTDWVTCAFLLGGRGEALVHPDPLLAPPGSARRKSGELAVDEEKKK